MKNFKKLIVAISIYVMCGFTYSLIKDNVIPNIKNRIHPETTLYSINIFLDKTSIKNLVVRREPYFEDNVFYYYDDNGDLNKLINFSIIVTRTYEKELK